MEFDLNGCQIYYELHGQPDGEPIFFIHGAPGLGDCRGDIKAFYALGDQYRLVFLDMRGSGRSAEQPPYTHAQWTADIDALRDFLGYETIIILGGSYGGFLALEYTVRYPERVSHVILRDTAASNTHKDGSMQKALDSDRVDIDRDTLERLFEGQITSNEELKETFRAIQPLYTVEIDEDAIEERINNIYYHYETHNYAFSENKKSYDVTEAIKSIDVPVLVTVGIHDWVTPVECSDVIAANIPRSTYVKFQHSGHSPHHEENEKFLILVRDFLKKTSS